jgi:hypothetical protein
MVQQRYEILRALRAAGLRGLTSRQMSHDMEIERFGARLKELRDEGYDIATLRDPDSADGKRRFRYVLMDEPEHLEQPASAPPNGQGAVDVPPSGALFDIPPVEVTRSAVTGREIAA